MSMMYCEKCDKQIDTDKDAEHFDEHKQQDECEHENVDTVPIEADDFNPATGHSTHVTGYMQVCVDCDKELGEVGAGDEV